jgi:hypothetical protein
MNSRGRIVFQKTWNDKMKGKKEKRKKGFKPPFFKKNPKKISKEIQPKMSTRQHIHFGKNPR